MKLKFLAAIGFAATLYSCDDSTTGIGDFIADTDEINAYSETYDVTTKTVSVADINKKLASTLTGFIHVPVQLILATLPTRVSVNLLLILSRK